MSVELCRTVPELRRRVASWRARGERVALVPTMGALHAGHVALAAAGREVAERTVVTVFVNPTQFAPGEDFQTYPRDLDADCRTVAAAGADLVFAPDVSAIYPRGFATTVTVGGPALAGLEDRFRPAHFVGVATVVAKLLGQALPDVALFGEKDFQQLRVIERMVRDLDMPVAIRGVPTVREVDGLALSSRNVRLDATERARAPVLHRVLTDCVGSIRVGAPLAASLDAARSRLRAAGFALDYLEARSGNDLAPLEAAAGGAAGCGRLLVAAHLGRTRLIDNVDIARDQV